MPRTFKKKRGLMYARVYKAYFFEDKEWPISVHVFAHSFDSAIKKLESVFPGRTISALHGENSTFDAVPPLSAVLICPEVSENEVADRPRDFHGIPDDVREYFYKPAERKELPPAATEGELRKQIAELEKRVADLQEVWSFRQIQRTTR